MVGRSLSATLHGAAQRMPRPYGRRVLSAQNLSSGSMVRNTSFSIYAGQIAGIFGLVGAGRTEMMKVVAGVIKSHVNNLWNLTKGLGPRPSPIPNDELAVEKVPTIVRACP